VSVTFWFTNFCRRKWPVPRIQSVALGWTVPYTSVISLQPTTSAASLTARASPEKRGSFAITLPRSNVCPLRHMTACVTGPLPSYELGGGEFVVCDLPTAPTIAL